jgi:hypothetical protein
MKTSGYAQAVDAALGQAMARDDRIFLLGEDVPPLRRNLLGGSAPGGFGVRPSARASLSGQRGMRRWLACARWSRCAWSVFRPCAWMLS